MLDSVTLPSRRQQKRDQREQAILDLAHHIIATQGYMAMTMDDLAARLEVSTGTLYQHFASKEDLACAIGERFLHMKETFLDGQDDSQPAVVRLEALLRWCAHERFQNEWPDLEALISTLRNDGPHRPEYHALQKRVHARIAGLIEEAKQSGDVRADLATPVIVEMFRACVATGAYTRLLRDRETTPAALGDTIVKTLFRGVCVVNNKSE